MTPPRELAAAFRDSRRDLWGLCYRMTGCAADADDLVQEAFARAIARPPRDLTRPLGPWLAKVAVNLSRDHLRRPRRRGYAGLFLAAAVEPAAYESDSTAGRYDLCESVSLAFLLALEALTPQKRAVLPLRDVLQYTVRETAGALDMTEADVKTTLHRARRQMATYDAQRRPPELRPAVATSLQALFERLSVRDHDGFAALLAADVQALSDGGGVYSAALRPVCGPAKVARFFFGLLDQRRLPSRADMRVLNGSPALVTQRAGPQGAAAPTSVTWIRLALDGRIAAVYSQLAPRKLTRRHRVLPP